jgi:hypothetical protein
MRLRDPKPSVHIKCVDVPTVLRQRDLLEFHRRSLRSRSAPYPGGKPRGSVPDMSPVNSHPLRRPSTLVEDPEDGANREVDDKKGSDAEPEPNGHGSAATPKTLIDGQGPCNRGARRQTREATNPATCGRTNKIPIVRMTCDVSMGMSLPG